MESPVSRVTTEESSASKERVADFVGSSMLVAVTE
jgi:hypothetical protein